MIWKKDEWATYCCVMVITVIVLVGGQLLWHKFAVAKPLDKGLHQIQGVETVNWQEDGKSGVMSIEITLNKVDNLQKTYREINAAVYRALGRKPFKLILKDNRTPELENEYYQLHFLIQEAIQTGNYSTMAEKVAKQAGTEDIEAKVYVDDGAVFSSIKKG